MQHFDITLDQHAPFIDGGGIIVGIMFDPRTKRRIQPDEAVRMVHERKSLDVDGHYAGIAVVDGRIVELVDPYELRRLYRTTLPDGRIRYMTKLPGSSPPGSLDLRVLANAWMPVMGFTHSSMVEGIERCLPSPGPLHSTGRTSTERKDDLAPSLDGFPDSVLALSGGFDSRTLLAWCIGEGIDISTTSYGSMDMPDCSTASDVASRAGVRHTFLDIATVVDRMSIDDMQSIARHTALASEGTYHFAHAMALPSIASILPPSGILIDGGFGGFLRGGLANGLRYQGRTALHSGDARRILPYLMARSNDVFVEDVARRMTDMVTEDLQRALDGQGPCTKGSEREWIDDFFASWYLHGYVASPQGVYDHYLDSTIPFLHRSVVDWVFSRPASFRDHGRWFRSVISSSAPRTTSVPFVGKRSLYPWFCAGRPLMNALHSKISRTRFVQSDTISDVVYGKMKEPVDDLLHSSWVGQLGIWNIDNLRSAADKLAVYGYLQLIT